jgi:hypothetical protein
MKRIISLLGAVALLAGCQNRVTVTYNLGKINPETEVLLFDDKGNEFNFVVMRNNQTNYSVVVFGSAGIQYVFPASWGKASEVARKQ